MCRGYIGGTCHVIHTRMGMNLENAIRRARWHSLCRASG